MKIESITIRKCVDYQTVETTISIEDKSELNSARELAQKLTDVLIEDTIKAKNALEPKVLGQTPAPAPRTYSGGGKRLSTKQIDYALKLKTWGKLDPNWNPDMPNALELFQAAAEGNK